ncbi:NHL repeat-containing protein [Pseudomonas botevensis]|uniref:hypothetical protein n=1 Tax=Pseudomonas botevensis TaxID=2842352 RepID=UPI001C3DA729|nr:hypothetical protein [Pseudomonas botevensis]MBV4472801.1 hypothetical protein [Pseudomonas botevensis]
MNQALGIKQPGTFDPAFNKGKFLGLPFSGRSELSADGVLALPEGKAIILSRSWETPEKYVLARLNADGSADTQFGENNQGIVEVRIKGLIDLMIFSITHTENGGWLVFAQGTFEQYTALLLIRHLQDGELDLTLNGNGILNIPYGNFGNSGYDAIPVTASSRIDAQTSNSAGQLSQGGAVPVIAQADGKIVIVSNAYNRSGKIQAIVLRRNANGSRDTSLNEKGSAFVELEGVMYDWSTGMGVALQPDGCIVVCGDFFNQERGISGVFVTRLTYAGKGDNEFNEGRPVTLTSGFSMRLHSVSLRESDGRIVAVGRSREALEERQKGLIMVLNKSGSNSLPFNKGKPLYSGFLSQGLNWRYCVSQEDGAIVVGGSVGAGVIDDELSTVVARFLPDATLDPIFGGKGYSVFNESEFIEEPAGMAMRDERLFMCGSFWQDQDPYPSVTGGFVLCYLLR